MCGTWSEVTEFCSATAVLLSAGCTLFMAVALLGPKLGNPSNWILLQCQMNF